MGAGHLPGPEQLSLHKERQPQSPRETGREEPLGFAPKQGSQPPGLSAGLKCNYGYLAPSSSPSFPNTRRQHLPLLGGAGKPARR